MRSMRKFLSNIINPMFNDAYRMPTKYAEDKVDLCVGYTPVPIKFLTVSAAELWHTSLHTLPRNREA